MAVLITVSLRPGLAPALRRLGRGATLPPALMAPSPGVVALAQDPLTGFTAAPRTDAAIDAALSSARGQEAPDSEGPVGLGLDAASRSAGGARRPVMPFAPADRSAGLPFGRSRLDRDHPSSRVPLLPAGAEASTSAVPGQRPLRFDQARPDPTARASRLGTAAPTLAPWAARRLGVDPTVPMASPAGARHAISGGAGSGPDPGGGLGGGSASDPGGGRGRGPGSAARGGRGGGSGSGQGGAGGGGPGPCPGSGATVSSPMSLATRRHSPPRAPGRRDGASADREILDAPAWWARGALRAGTEKEPASSQASTVDIAGGSAAYSAGAVRGGGTPVAGPWTTSGARGALAAPHSLSRAALVAMAWPTPEAEHRPRPEDRSRALSPDADARSDRSAEALLAAEVSHSAHRESQPHATTGAPNHAGISHLQASGNSALRGLAGLAGARASQEPGPALAGNGAVKGLAGLAAAWASQEVRTGAPGAAPSNNAGHHPRSGRLQDPALPPPGLVEWAGPRSGGTPAPAAVTGLESLLAFTSVLEQVLLGEAAVHGIEVPR